MRYDESVCYATLDADALEHNFLEPIAKLRLGFETLLEPRDRHRPDSYLAQRRELCPQTARH